MPIADVNELKMYYELGDAGTPLVLISPLSGDHFSWVLNVPDFTAAGYRCLVFDSRDAGQTGESPTGPYTIRRLADDTAALMAAVGITRAHVVGGSMGGMIALELALNYPERVTTLTLVCTVAGVDDEVGSVIRAWQKIRPLCSPDEFFRAISPYLFSYRFFQQPEPMAVVLDMVRGNPFPQTAAGFGRQADAILTHDTQARLATLATPAHVIVGSEDILTPARYSRALAAAIPGARLTEIPAVAHALFSERPAEFNEAVLEFLSAAAV